MTSSSLRLFVPKSKPEATPKVLWGGLYKETRSLSSISMGSAKNDDNNSVSPSKLTSPFAKTVTFAVVLVPQSPR